MVTKKLSYIRKRLATLANLPGRFELETFTMDHWDNLTVKLAYTQAIFQVHYVRIYGNNPEQIELSIKCY